MLVWVHRANRKQVNIYNASCSKCLCNYRLIYKYYFVGLLKVCQLCEICTQHPSLHKYKLNTFFCSLCIGLAGRTPATRCHLQDNVKSLKWLQSVFGSLKSAAQSTAQAARWFQKTTELEKVSCIDQVCLQEFSSYSVCPFLFIELRCLQQNISLCRKTIEISGCRFEQLTMI